MLSVFFFFLNADIFFFSFFSSSSSLLSNTSPCISHCRPPPGYLSSLSNNIHNVLWVRLARSSSSFASPSLRCCTNTTHRWYAVFLTSLPSPTSLYHISQSPLVPYALCLSVISPFSLISSPISSTPSSPLLFPPSSCFWMWCRHSVNMWSSSTPLPLVAVSWLLSSSSLFFFSLFVSCLRRPPLLAFTSTRSLTPRPTSITLFLSLSFCHTPPLLVCPPPFVNSFSCAGCLPFPAIFTFLLCRLFSPNSPSLPRYVSARAQSVSVHVSADVCVPFQTSTRAHVPCSFASVFVCFIHKG